MNIKVLLSSLIQEIMCSRFIILLKVMKFAPFPKVKFLVRDHFHIL
ncbi:hypothetical protein Y888_06435 [Mixta calida B021323]|nr:hypothetical protein Y888_06435 [Mixta calida B021323]